jgi:isoamylase
MPIDPPGEMWPGRAYPLGPHYDGLGTNFSLFSEIADAVELCLFHEDGTERRISLTEVDGYCWHAYIPGLRPGQRYGYRVHGPWDPARGLRCNPHKLLIDPYARAIAGRVDWTGACFGHVFGDEDRRNDLDSAAHVPKSVVHDPVFDWGADKRPETPRHDSILYEVHVRGFTMQHPAIPPAMRGTYAALAERPVIDYLLHLGVTAIQLMPVHQFVHDQHLLERDLRNYWGYNTIGFFAPHNEYASGADRGDQVVEFKAMVKALHAVGIEVILDVVYNHTAEGNHLGPMLSFKGIDNRAYYRLVPGNERFYFDTTGTGNSMNSRHPHVLQLILDSLRYWVEEMHVDGFRFDLAAALARDLYEVNRLSAFFDVIQQDPIVSRVKLIAEPWDLGSGGYQVGNFPPVWSEWNGRYRDTIRDFWRGTDAVIGEFASRITGSSDLYQATTRGPTASVNLITAHDGFTLADLVSYNHKHNDANQESNRDGEWNNRSWNCGAEGEAIDPAVHSLRRRQQRNFIATLLLSQGIPMILGGDEIGRSQRGNNNAYCQDNEISWVDWSLATQNEDLLEFTRQMIAMRRIHALFRQRRWFQGRPIRGTRDIGWYRPDGVTMSDDDWRTGFAKSLGVFLSGEGLATPDDRGRTIRDDSFLLLFNAHYEPLDWAIPPELGDGWEIVVDTAEPLLEIPFLLSAGTSLRVPAHAIRVLRQPRRKP